MRHLKKSALMAVILGFALTSPVFSQRTQLKPGGFNLFSPQQDAELGKQVALDAEKKLSMLNNSRVDDYLSRLGGKLVAGAAGQKYEYRFKCVNDPTINAFALPGGFLFVNRGTIEAADNEAELAGVIGHEIGHIALRHGTKQATKSYLTQAPLAILGGFLGRGAFATILNLFGEFGANSVLLKYSRDDERQADLFGTQVLFDSNYDPQYLATFFEKLGTEQRGLSWLSSHPNPQDRIKTIDGEIDRLGASSGRRVNDTNEFRSIRNYVKSLPPAPKAGSEQSRSQDQGQDNGVLRQGRPQLPSGRYQIHNAGNLTVRHPDNWTAYGEEQAFTLAPEGGIVQRENGEALAYGAIMSVYAVNLSGSSPATLKNSTDQLIRELQNSNPAMRSSGQQNQIRVGGQAALSRILTNDSPLGGRERNWLVTVLRPEGLVYFMFVAPEQEFSNYQSAFQQIIDSVKFN